MSDGAHYFEQLALSESPDALILMTAEGRILHWSRGAEAMFGYGRAQVLGHTIGELLIPADRIAEEAQFLKETLEKGFATFVSVRRRQNGALLYVDVSSRVVREPACSIAFNDTIIPYSGYNVSLLSSSGRSGTISPLTPAATSASRNRSRPLLRITFA